METTTRIRTLVGSGDRIALRVLPFVVVGVGLNVAFPEAFHVGGPPTVLRIVSLALLAVGVVVWAWSAALILTRVPRGELITGGPFALVRHPLYTGVSLLVLPWAGFLLDTWLGAVLGAVMYLASRRYAPAEEEALATEFGTAWEEYLRSVRVPWL